MTLRSTTKNNHSTFKHEYPLAARIAKRNKLAALHHENNKLCYLVLQYAEPISGKKYELYTIRDLECA